MAPLGRGPRGRRPPPAPRRRPRRAVRRRARRRAQTKAAGSALALVLLAGSIGTAITLTGAERTALPAEEATAVEPTPTPTAIPTPTPTPTATAPSAVEPFSQVRWRDHTYTIDCGAGPEQVTLTDGAGACTAGPVSLESRDITVGGDPFRLVEFTVDQAERPRSVVHVYAPSQDGGARLSVEAVTWEQDLPGFTWDGTALTSVGQSGSFDGGYAVVTFGRDGDDVTVEDNAGQAQALYTLELGAVAQGDNVAGLRLETGGTAWPLLMTDGRQLALDRWLLEIQWGDGATDSEGETEGVDRCLTELAPQTLTPRSSAYEHTYPAPGTYTIRVTVTTCSSSDPGASIGDIDPVVGEVEVVVE